LGSPSRENPIGIGKSTVRYDCDAHDDELQGFSKSAVAPISEMRMVRWVGSIGSASATERVTVDAPPGL
jgi:hypothetical protein